MRKTDAASFQNTMRFITLVIIEWIISCYGVRSITLSISDNTVTYHVCHYFGKVSDSIPD